MPPLPAAAGVLKCSVLGNVASSPPALTRFFIHYSGTAPTVAQLGTFNASLATGWNTNLKALTTADYTLAQIESIDLTSSTGAVAITAESIVGTRAGNANTAATALVCSYNVPRRYRGGHPRGYWRLGAYADVSTDRTWTSAFVTSAQSGLTAFFAAAVAAGWSGAGTLTQVNVSYYSGFTVVVSPTTGRARNVPKLRVSPTIDTVSAIQVRAALGTQRRRTGFTE